MCHTNREDISVEVSGLQCVTGSSKVLQIVRRVTFVTVSPAGKAPNCCTLAQRIFIGSTDGERAIFVFACGSLKCICFVFTEEILGTCLNCTTSNRSSCRQTKDVLFVLCILPRILVSELRSDSSEVIAQAKVNVISCFAVAAFIVCRFKNKSVAITTKLVSET